MQIFDNYDIVTTCRPRGVGLGFFDGVHRGHQELIRTLAYVCKPQGLLPAVFTFPEHPDTVLHPGSFSGSYLSGLDERLRLLGANGVAEVHLQHFTREFAQLDPCDFLRQVLKERLQARLIVVGQDYRFGRQGRGTVELLRTWAADQGIEVIVIGQVSLFGEKVSSSRIRSLIGAGDVERAASLLGRPYSLTGSVLHGRALGRRLGFPTANLAVPADLACPAHGVYATRTMIGSRTFNSITNVGVRPTVDSSGEQPMIETHIYDLDFSLYGQPVRIDFLRRIRPEIRFDSLPELEEQLKSDVLQVREWHLDSEQCHEIARTEGIPVYLLPTRRFAQAALHLVFCSPIEARRSSCLSLLMRILTSSCRRYPTRTSLAAALDNLYGAAIEAHVDKHGDLQVIDLTAEGLISWSDGSSPFRETCGLLFEMLLDPLLDHDGLFDEQTVETERQNLILELAARENDRAKYAYDRCMALFCGTQAQGLLSSGDRRNVQDITRSELIDAYRILLQQTSLALYLGGQVDAETVGICLNGIRRLPAGCRPEVHPAVLPSPFVPEPPSGQIENRSIEQARIVLAYSGLPPYFSHQSIQATVLNSMLGGDAHSLLFDVVREKLGLAYSVFSMNQRFLSALFIMAGVAADRTEPALHAIQEQIAHLSAGRFDRTLLDRAVQMLEAAILSVADDLSSLLAQQIIGRLSGRLLNREESLSLLHEVEPEQICELAGRLTLISCYIMTDPEHHPDLAAAGCPGPQSGAR